jgi:hypothetical protein
MLAKFYMGVLFARGKQKEKKLSKREITLLGNLVALLIHTSYRNKQI